MTLDEFLSELRESEASFAKKWREGMETDQSQWPPELPAEEWWEQYLAHVSLEVY